ncbi:MAG: hypothetical protein WC505_07245 [Patescibacteria group bacterium]
MGLLTSSLKAGYLATHAVMNDLLFWVNGRDRNVKFNGEGAAVTNMGIRTPATNCAIADGAAGLVTAGNHYVVYTFYNQNDGTESDPSPVSAVLNSAGTVKIDVSSVDVSSDTQTTHRLFYMTEAGGPDSGPFYACFDENYTTGCIADNTSTTGTIDVSDDSLQMELGEYDSDETFMHYSFAVPPSCKFITEHAGRLFLAGDDPMVLGTASVINGNTSVVLTGSDVTDGDIGKFFQVEGDEYLYTITAVTGATLTLHVAYKGTTDTAASYTIVGDQRRLYYSNIEEPEEWPNDSEYGNSFIVTDTPITGIVSFQGNIVVGELGALWIVAGSGRTSWQRRKMEIALGCVSHYTMHEDKGLLYYLSPNRGLCVFNGQSSQTVSGNLQNDSGIFGFDGLNSKYLKYAYGAIFDGKYFLAVPYGDSTENNHLYVYNLNTRNWMPYTDLNIRVLEIGLDADEQYHLFAGDYDGFVYKLWTGTSDKISPAYSGTATGGTVDTLIDLGASFSTLGSGIIGARIEIVAGTGIGQVRYISSNTATMVEVSLDWLVTPDATSVYTIGAIDFYWKSKRDDWGIPIIQKVYSHTQVACAEQGSGTLKFDYFPDYATISEGQTDIDMTSGWRNIVSWQAYSRARAKFMQVMFSNKEIEQPVELLHYVVEADKQDKI